MSAWLKGLIAGTCFVVMVAAGVVIYFQFFPHQAATNLVATPKQIARCEKQVADAMLYPLNQDPPEGVGRGFAIGLIGGEDYGLFPPASKAYLTRSKLAPYLEAYSANRDVWRKQ